MRGALSVPFLLPSPAQLSLAHIRKDSALTCMVVGDSSPPQLGTTARQSRQKPQGPSPATLLTCLQHTPPYLHSTPPTQAEPAALPRMRYAREQPRHDRVPRIRASRKLAVGSIWMAWWPPPHLVLSGALRLCASFRTTFRTAGF